LTDLIVGSTLFGIEGPFGYPALIENFGTVLCVGRGSGIIALLPVLNSLRVAGNRILTILSARSKDEILLQDEIKAISDEVITITDEGSCGEKISICQAVGQVVRNNRISQVFVIGTAKTIKETCSHATKNNIRVQAILHIGRTVEHGAHGIFRVSSCGSGRSVCVDGFSFNAYYLNFEEMIKRFGSEEFDMTGKLRVPNKENIPV
jgi:NAD(P)H-flavin reductase